MNTDFDRKQLAREAKAIVALAFRNGPIENCMADGPVPRARASLVIPGSPKPR